MLRGKVGGYSRFTNLFGQVVEECETSKCTHCQRIIEVPARADPNNVHGWCYSCDAAQCVACQQKMDAGNPCVHWARALEMSLRRYDMLRDMGL